MVARDDYAWMARDATESERLEMQHHVIAKTMGYLIHPKISLPSNARIADVATGTGVILLELAKTLPQACQLDGFDISDAQFPANHPSNVKFHLADVKHPLPSKYHGQFDVANIRYLNAGMKAEDWKIVTENVSALLKPGGWFQWIEGDFSQLRFWPLLDPLKESDGAIHEFVELMSPGLESFRYFVFELEDAFREAGLKNVSREVTSTDRLPETRPLWTTVNIGPPDEPHYVPAKDWENTSVAEVLLRFAG